MRIRNCIYGAGVVLVAVMVGFCFVSGGWAMSKKQKEPTYAAGEVLVKFEEGASPDRIDQIIASEKAVISRSIGTGTLLLLALPEGMKVMDAVNRFSAYPEVEYAEPNYKVQRLEK